MILNVRHLEMVKTIHEEGTLTAASRRLFMSQPALSRQLAKLESRLGTKVFRRHPKGMALTREGHRLLKAAERVLGEIARAEDDVRLLAQGYVGTVRVTTECYMCYHWLPWVARTFGDRFPKVEVQLVPEATRDPYGAVERSSVDLALVYSTPPDPRSVERAEIFNDELVGVVAAGHRLAGESNLTPESFATETLLCHYTEPGNGVVEREFFGSSRARPKRTMEMLVTPAVLEMARAGYGVAVVPRWILGAHDSLEGVTVLPLGNGGLWRTWYAAYPASRKEEPVLESMIEVLRAELRREQPVASGTTRPRIHLA